MKILESNNEVTTRENTYYTAKARYERLFAAWCEKMGYHAASLSNRYEFHTTTLGEQLLTAWRNES